MIKYNFLCFFLLLFIVVNAAIETNIIDEFPCLLSEELTVDDSYYQDFDLNNGNITNHYGSSIVNMGDINGDGIDDIAVGANDNTLYDDEGNQIVKRMDQVYIHLLTEQYILNYAVSNFTKDGVGNSTGVLETIRISMENVTSDGDFKIMQNKNSFGQSLCNLGDLDNNGVNDLAIGVPREDDGEFINSGMVVIVLLNSYASIIAYDFFIQKVLWHLKFFLVILLLHFLI